jgi:hypothetical protein
LCGLFENAVNSCDHIVSSDMWTLLIYRKSCGRKQLKSNLR